MFCLKLKLRAFDFPVFTIFFVDGCCAQSSSNVLPGLKYNILLHVQMSQMLVFGDFVDFYPSCHPTVLPIFKCYASTWVKEAKVKSSGDIVHELGAEVSWHISATMWATRSEKQLGRRPSAYSPSFVAQLQDRLQVTETALQTTQEHLHSTEEELRSTREELEDLRRAREELVAAKKDIEEQRLALTDLNARFESFSSLLGHPTRADNSQQSL